MNKKKFSNFQNPLNQRKQVRESHEGINEPDRLKFIQRYGKSSNISSSLLNQIDFHDKEYIRFLQQCCWAAYISPDKVTPRPGRT